MSRALRDALGRRVPLLPAPRRIVALVPSVTRCLFDLGIGDRVVGRTEFCREPAGRVAGLPAVGGPQTVQVERVLELRPDLVLADAEENQRDQVEALQGAGLRVYVALPRSLAQVTRFLRDLGTLVDRRATTEPWAAELEDLARAAPSPPVRTACLVWQAPYMAAAPDTLPDAVLTAAGGRNVVTGRARRYPEITAAELARARPRVVLLPDDPYPFSPGDAVAIESAVPGCVALRVPGEWLAWYGSRMGESIRGLARVLAPYR